MLYVRFDICCQAVSVATQTIGQHHVQFLFLIVVVVTAGESFSVDQVQPGFPSDEFSDWASELLLADQDGLLELVSPQESVQGRLKSHSSFWSNELKPDSGTRATCHPSHDVSSQAFPDFKTRTISRNGEGLGTEANSTPSPTRHGQNVLIPLLSLLNSFSL